MGGNTDYYNHILVTFETTGKFVIVFVRLILGKWGLTYLPGHDEKVTSQFLSLWKVEVAVIEITTTIFW